MPMSATLAWDEPTGSWLALGSSAECRPGLGEADWSGEGIGLVGPARHPGEANRST